MSKRRATDTEWVGEVMQKYEGPLLRYAASITGDADRARDVVQEAFIALYESDDRAPFNHLSPWLYTVVRNRALNVRKKEARMSPLLTGQAEALENGAAHPGEAAVNNETHHLLAEALGHLPENQREACRLKFQGGLTYREISETMNISLGKVSNLIAQALDSIRLELRAKTGLTQEG